LRSILGRKWRVSRTPLRTFTAKKTDPIRIRDFQKGLGLENTEIVHENVSFGNLLDEPRNAFGISQIGGDAADIRAFVALMKGIERGGDTRFRAAIDDDARAFFRKCGSDGKADSRGRAGHNGLLALQTQFHDSFPLV